MRTQCKQNELIVWQFVKQQLLQMIYILKKLYLHWFARFCTINSSHDHDTHRGATLSMAPLPAPRFIRVGDLHLPTASALHRITRVIRSFPLGQAACFAAGLEGATTAVAATGCVNSPL